MVNSLPPGSDKTNAFQKHKGCAPNIVVLYLYSSGGSLIKKGGEAIVGGVESVIQSMLCGGIPLTRAPDVPTTAHCRLRGYAEP